jgi:hypothetical protein
MAELERLVPRVVEAQQSTAPFAMAHLILSTPQPLDRVDAIAVIPGLGEYERIVAAVDAWEASPKARHFLVAGTNGIEQTQVQPTLTFLQGDPIYLQRSEGVETQVAAEHTRDQAEWLIKRVKELHITSMALFVSHWHLSRAYSTLIKTMLKDGDVHIPIFPIAVASPPHTIVPELGKTVVELSPGEAERIQKYQETGDVATLAELETYLTWLWQQDVVPIGNSSPRHRSR